MQPKRRLPIGIQSFEIIRNDNMVYVDKTDLVYNLVSSYCFVFLSRPRRFGKSLLVSTIKNLFWGNRELFKGLKIDSLEKDWVKHPVLNISFASSDSGSDAASLRQTIDYYLSAWEKDYAIKPSDAPLGLRLANVIRTAHTLTGQRVVFLVDEYDHPLLANSADFGNNPYFLNAHSTQTSEQDKVRNILKGFYGALKDCAEHIRFALFTGVTKMTKVSIFSELNNLKDISMNPQFSAICGVTESELVANFEPEILQLAQANSLSVPHCLLNLKRKYDGYHFAPNMLGVYNPFSLINAFDDKQFGNYWFESGSPTFLLHRIVESNLSIASISDHEIKASPDDLMSLVPEDMQLIPLLYQTGYLTLSQGPDEFGEFILAFPNEEVSMSFFKRLAPMYMRQISTFGEHGVRYTDIVRELRMGNLANVMNILTSLFASVPYAASVSGGAFAYTEALFQNAFYILFTLLGYDVRSEVRFAHGRADAIVQTSDTVYIFEFKRDGSATEAIEQIRNQAYDVPFRALNKRIRLVGVNFSSQTKTISDWCEA